ncbi:MAG: potassium transporter TrkG, partial [Eubacterium sp.]
LFLTIIEFLLLWIGSDMSAFEALVNTLGSISTAGLFLHPEGIGYYDSIYVELIISLFTLLASVNFILYIHLLRRNFADIQKNIELRVFFGILAIATILVSCGLYIYGGYHSLSLAFRHGFFQVTSFITTSGFAITDYTLWPSICKSILFTLLFVGGCAASTSGGPKIIRLMIMFKLVVRGFFKRLHPRAVSSINVGETVISAPMVSSIATFIALYALTFLFSALVLSLQNLSLESTLSTAAALMSTTGAAFG